MKSVIKQMLLGKIGNFEQIKTSPEYLRVLDKTIKCEAEFKAKLAAHCEAVKLYKKVNTALNELICETEATHYAEGFKFGLLLGLEVAKE